MKSAVWVMVAVMVAGGAVAAPLKGMQVWAGRQGTGVVERTLSSRGVTNATEQAAVTAAWDEAVLIDVALANQAYGLVNWAMGLSPFSRRGLDRVKGAVLEEVKPVRDVIEIALQYPKAERAEFRSALEGGIPERFPERPAYGRLYVEQTVLRGVKCLGADVPEADLVAVLLADEPMAMSLVQQCKESIKQRSIVLARRRLRAEGKTFVTGKDEVNPLVVRVEPVVAALNAPACEGLEAALRALGAEMADVDRSAMLATAARWQGLIMAGEVSGPRAAAWLGKIAVALGPEAYNRFIEAYNNGSGEAGGRHGDAETGRRGE